jgi:hypothetical protein
VSDTPFTFKAYALCSYVWQYDDENHYNDGGAFSEFVFMNEQKAQDTCLTFNINCLRGTDICDYANDGVRGYVSGGYEMENLTAFVEWANKLLGTEWSADDGEMVVPEDASAENIKSLMERVSLRFYEVVEVPLDPDTSFVKKQEPKKLAPPEPSVEMPVEPERTIFLED